MEAEATPPAISNLRRGVRREGPASGQTRPNWYPRSSQLPSLGLVSPWPVGGSVRTALQQPGSPRQTCLMPAECMDGPEQLPQAQPEPGHRALVCAERDGQTRLCPCCLSSHCTRGGTESSTPSALISGGPREVLSVRS